MNCVLILFAYEILCLSPLTELLLDYGVDYISSIQEESIRAAALIVLPRKCFQPKKGGWFCKKCKVFFNTLAKRAPHSKSKCKNRR